MSYYPSNPESDIKSGSILGCYAVSKIYHRAENMDRDVYSVKTLCCDRETTRARNSLMASKKVKQTQCKICRIGRPAGTKHSAEIAKKINLQNKTQDALDIQSEWMIRPWGSATKLQLSPVTL